MVRLPPPASIDPSRRERAAGSALFLGVTAGWTIWLVAAELSSLGLLSPLDLGGLIAAVPSAISLVVTGYLCRARSALWLGWIPGTAMMAAGFALTPTPGGDETGGALIFVGGLVLGLAWPCWFFPLISVGAGLRGRRMRALAEEIEAPANLEARS